VAASTILDTVQREDGRGNGGGGLWGRGGDGHGEPNVPQRAYVTGMLIAIGAIGMFFAALVSAWVVRKGLSTADWRSFPLPRILWLNTVILVASSVTLFRARQFLTRGRVADYCHWWRVTTILGALFLAGQLLAWRQMFAAGLFLATSPGSSFFYVFTAAHGLHVLGGIAALLVVALRQPRRLTRATAASLVCLYWHFLAAVWILVFFLLLET
jgi:cytochrome c oxidase subunit III